MSQWHVAMNWIFVKEAQGSWLDGTRLLCNGELVVWSAWETRQSSTWDWLHTWEERCPACVDAYPTSSALFSVTMVRQKADVVL